MRRTQRRRQASVVGTATALLFLVTGCMGPPGDRRNPDEAKPGGIVWSASETLRFETSVAPNSVQYRFVRIDQASIPSGPNETLTITHSSFLQFPPDTGPGWVFFTQHFLVLGATGSARPNPEEDLDVAASWYVAHIPEGSRQLTLPPNSSFERPLDKPLRLVGLIAGGTIPFTITAEYHFKARINETNWSTSQQPLMFALGSDPALVQNESYPYRSELSLEAGNRSFVVAGVVVTPPPRHNLWDLYEASLEFRSQCDSETARGTRRGGGSGYWDNYEPAAPADNPRAAEMLNGFCRQGTSLGTISAIVHSKGVTPSRPFVAAIDLDAWSTWLPLLS